MIDKNRIKKRFFAVNKIIGVSGSETEIIRYCRDELVSLADNISIHYDGTLIAEFRGAKPGPKLMIDAHVDEIGISVKYIDPKGFLFYDSFGVNMNSLIGRRILLQGSKGQVLGLVGITPGHILTAAEQNTLPSVAQSYIDVGANSYEEVLEMGIDIGTTGVYDSFATEMNNPDLIVSRSVDNRLGVAYLLELAQDIRDKSFPGTVYFSFSTQEELACLGAAFASQRIDPDYAIVTDTIPAGGTPDVPDRRLPIFMGKGPVLSYGDQSGNGAFRTLNNQRLLKAAEEAAKKLNIPIQKTAMYSLGGYVTNTSGITRLGSHCPAFTIATPRRYSHSPIELLNLNDAVYAFELLSYFVQNNGSFSCEFLE